jgi:hypothetical protein
LARVLRFQIATAIPPKAAELASNRLVRQRFRRCGGGTEASTFDLKGMGMDNLRKGMDDLIRKMYGRGGLRETFSRNLRLCYGKGRS